MNNRKNRARLGSVSLAGKSFHVSADGKTIFIRPRYGRVEFTVPIRTIVYSALYETPASGRPASPQNS